MGLRLDAREKCLELGARVKIAPRTACKHDKAEAATGYMRSHRRHERFHRNRLRPQGWGGVGWGG